MPNDLGDVGKRLAGRSVGDLGCWVLDLYCLFLGLRGWAAQTLLPMGGKYLQELSLTIKQIWLLSLWRDPTGCISP